jgi:acyl-CoA thioesterase
VALVANISFVAPGKAHARVIATAQERALGRRTGTYDVVVTDGEGRTLALFTGTSYRIGGPVITDEP